MQIHIESALFKQLMVPVVLESMVNRSERAKYMNRPPEQEVLLTPAEVARIFRVDPKTVTRWAKAGKITAIRTLGGHRRYRKSEIQALMRANGMEN